MKVTKQEFAGMQVGIENGEQIEQLQQLLKTFTHVELRRWVVATLFTLRSGDAALIKEDIFRMRNALNALARGEPFESE